MFLRASIFTILLSICLAPVQAQHQADKLLELYNIINMAYVDSFSAEELNEAAIVSMLEILDPHSIYIPKDQVKAMNENLEGKYEGIGIQFDMYRDTVLVVTPVPGGPSYNLGIQAGDKIIEADGQVLSGVGKTDEEIISTLRGKHGTEVHLTIAREGFSRTMEYTVVRDKIPIHSVDVGYMIAPNTGYIKVNRFSKNTLSEFQNELKALLEDDMEQLILDLRGNGGGYLYSAVQLADEFIDGKQTIVRTSGLRQSDRHYKSKPKGMFTKGKLIVLIDEGSASASEIVAGALQDLDRGLIVGRRSFGKGLVMKPYSLSDGSVVRLTTSRYYTPSGRCIQKDYSGSKENYQDEIATRFENGEVLHYDSIKFPDSLKFKTKNGRLVYGGGGIVPDIFVPADSSIMKEDFQALFKSGIFIEFSMEFVQQNRKDLLKDYPDVSSFMKDEAVNVLLKNSLNEAILKEEILDEALADEFIPAAINQTKSFIARYLWGERAYYIAINSRQNVIDKSLSLLQNEEVDWTALSYFPK